MKHYNLHTKPHTDAPKHAGSYCFDTYGNRVERLPDPDHPGVLSDDVVIILAPGSPLTVAQVADWYWGRIGARTVDPRLAADPDAGKRV